MKRLLIILISLVVLSACQPQKEKESPILKESAPASAGFSAERLARIDSTVNTWVAKGWINGAVGLIARDGKIVYYKASGYNDLETKAKLNRDDIFRIASQTKAITSVAVMMLYEKGNFYWKIRFQNSFLPLLI